MNTLHLIEPFLIVAAAAYLMMLAGLTKNTLERKRQPRTCPSCGRTAANCRCRH